MTRYSFTKMHGCGNDYLFFDGFRHPIDHPEQLAQRLCDRHFSVGGDGVVVFSPSHCADARMRIFNADGSEAEMCGNAIRCVGKYLYDHDLVRRTVMTVETLGGVRTLFLSAPDGRVASVRVDMGRAVLSAPDQTACPQSSFLLPLPEGRQIEVTCISTGNPHCVAFCPDIAALDLFQIGPLIERHAWFSRGVNAEFVQPLSATRLLTRVWERGSGETLSCGTGACAAVAASVHRGVCLKGQDIAVSLPGGELMVQYTDEAVYLTGPAAYSFQGEVTL